METTFADSTEAELSSNEEGRNKGLQSDESSCGLQGEESALASGSSQAADDEGNEAPNDERDVEPKGVMPLPAHQPHSLILAKQKTTQEVGSWQARPEI